MIDIFQHILFWPVLVSSVGGVVLLVFFPKSIVADRRILWMCAAAVVVACCWRFLLELPARRYYMIILPWSLPLAVIPFVLRGEDLPFFRYHRKWLAGLQIVMLLVIVGCCVGKACRREREPAEVLEMAQFIRVSIRHPEQQGVLIDNTTNGMRAIFFTKMPYRVETIWLWEYYQAGKENVNLGVIQRVLDGEKPVQTPCCYIFFRTSDPHPIQQLIQQKEKSGNCHVLRKQILRKNTDYIVLYALDILMPTNKNQTETLSQPSAAR